jgi:transposase
MEELSALPAAELAARLAEAYRLIGELTAHAEQLTAHAERLTAQNERLAARVEDLERQVRRDSSTSSRPPSSDSPYKPPSPWGVVASARKSGGRGAAP